MKKGAILVAMGAVLAGASSVRAEVKLPSLWSDNMVLQRGRDVPVWGTATGGEKVTVKFAGQEKSATAGVDGKWMVRLAPLKEATGLTLSVAGANTLVFNNVAVGDVYICSGQSNMEYSLGSWSPPDSEPGKKAAAEVAAANYPNIRLFSVPKAIKAEPLSDTVAPASWQVCTPESARNFSAVGYFFGRELHQKLNVPIGLINSSWGGTYAEAWTSRDTLAQMPAYKGGVQAMEEAARATQNIETRMAAWWTNNDPGSKDLAFARADAPDADWKTMKLPALWETAGLVDYNGIAWFRKTIDVPADWAGHDLTLHLGKIDDRDTAFWNGAPVGSTNSYDAARLYKVPGNMVKAGRQTIAVRVLDTGGGGGLYGDDMKLERADAPTNATATNATATNATATNATATNGPISLSGAWKYQATTALEKLPPVPAGFDGNPNQPTVLYNGMIAPLVPFALRGAIWYQGESNAGNAVAYRTLFPAMIRDWRAHFNQGDFGFYFVQLANFLPRAAQPNEGGWAELREAQSMTLALPKTGMATIIDIGQAEDIHPTNKLDVGKRLALAALADTYGQKIESSGPMFSGMKIEGSNVRITFSHAAGLKTKDGGAPQGFIIGEESRTSDGKPDKKFAWADARIEGNTVVLSSELIKNPTTARYAWANNPPTNLYNAADLPAVPFRTDAPTMGTK